jgi:hypothetical protein
MKALLKLFDDLIEKAPSACMGADDWLDKFFRNAEKELCTGMWCGNDRCKKHNGGDPYNCSEGCLPSKCEVWRGWRKQWRSYPENEICKKCKYYKPVSPYKCPANDKQYISSLLKTNQYKCYCRAKELPSGCPKKGKKEGEAKV